MAASLLSVAVRLRLEDVARFIADALGRALAAREGRPVHLLNIGGGPAPDSLNALILLARDHPERLAGREIRIQVLDTDEAGPSFGARALAALRADGAPLRGLNVGFDHVKYDWSDTSTLERFLRQTQAGDPAAIGSSEGGLFEYGSDEVIAANMEVLSAGTSDDFVMVGTLVRDAPFPQHANPSINFGGIGSGLATELGIATGRTAHIRQAVDLAVVAIIALLVAWFHVRRVVELSRSTSFPGSPSNRIAMAYFFVTCFVTLTLAGMGAIRAVDGLLALIAPGTFSTGVVLSGLTRTSASTVELISGLILVVLAGWTMRYHWRRGVWAQRMMTLPSEKGSVMAEPPPPEPPTQRTTPGS